MGALIIELVFDGDTLNPHIVIRRENFQFRRKKEAYSLDTQKILQKQWTIVFLLQGIPQDKK